MKTFAFIFLVLWSLFLVFFRALCISTLWAWFVFPIAGFNVGTVQVMGLLVFALAISKAGKSMKEEIKSMTLYESLSFYLLRPFAPPALAISLGWIIQTFIV